MEAAGLVDTDDRVGITVDDEHGGRPRRQLRGARGQRHRLAPSVVPRRIQRRGATEQTGNPPGRPSAPVTIEEGNGRIDQGDEIGGSPRQRDRGDRHAPLSDHRRQMASRRVAVHADTIGIELPPIGLVDHEPHGRFGVIDRVGDPMLPFREPVVDRHDRIAPFGPRRDRQGRRLVTIDPSAAVEVHHDGIADGRRRFGGPVHVESIAGRSVCVADIAFDVCADLGRVGWCCRPPRQHEAGARGCDGDDGNGYSDTSAEPHALSIGHDHLPRSPPPRSRMPRSRMPQQPSHDRRTQADEDEADRHRR